MHFTASLLAALLAHGQPPEAAETVVDEHVRLAAEHYTAGEYEDAIREIAAAYELDPQPRFLFPWAQSERQRGHCEAAIPLYARFLASSPSEEITAIVGQHIEACMEQLEADREPAPAPTTSSPSTTDRPRNVVAIALVGAGVGVTAVGVGLMLGARGTMLDAKDAETHSAFRSGARRARAMNGVGIAGLSLGLGLAAAGVVHWAVLRNRGGVRSASLWVAPSVGGVALGGRF